MSSAHTHVYACMYIVLQDLFVELTDMMATPHDPNREEDDDDDS